MDRVGPENSSIRSGILVVFPGLVFVGTPLVAGGISSTDSKVREHVEDELIGTNRMGQIIELQAQMDALQKKAADQRTMSVAELNAYIAELQVDNASLLALMMNEVHELHEDGNRRDRRATRQQFLYFIAGVIVSFPLGLLAAWGAKQWGIG